MSGHTPGPWAVDVAESSAPGMGSDVVRVDVMKGDQRIAGVTVRPGSKALSNARLIAAAPDMHEANALALTALENLWRAYMSDTHPNLDQMNDAMKALRAAIAKATGGTP